MYRASVVNEIGGINTYVRHVVAIVSEYNHSRGKIDDIVTRAVCFGGATWANVSPKLMFTKIRSHAY